MKWTYGDAWERLPIEEGQVWGLDNGSKVAVQDIFFPLPAWMKADLVFVDPPWNMGNLRSFYTKAEVQEVFDRFSSFSDMLMTRISDIGAQTVYIEMGNQSVKDFVERLAGFRYVQHWPVLYYKKHPTNLLRASNVSSTDYDFSGMDEAKCIQIIAGLEKYQVIADPCMGRGLVGMAAYNAGQPFVGTELNKRRLSVLLDNLAKKGANPKRL